MEDSLLSVGTRLRIQIDEDGSSKPPLLLPPGTVRRRIVGPSNAEYYLVELDEPVDCVRAANGSSWELRELLLSASFRGDALGRSGSAPGDFVPANIMNVLKPPYPPGKNLDHSKVVYFARGRVYRT